MSVLEVALDPATVIVAVDPGKAFHRVWISNGAGLLADPMSLPVSRERGKSPGVGFRACGWPGWAVSDVSLRALGWAIAYWSVSYRPKLTQAKGHTTR